MNFEFKEYDRLGHGAYMISSNGGSWSNSDREFNNVPKSFKYTKGDVIICDYNPEKSSLIFKKEKGEVFYHLKIDAQDLL